MLRLPASTRANESRSTGTRWPPLGLVGLNDTRELIELNLFDSAWGAVAEGEGKSISSASFQGKGIAPAYIVPLLRHYPDANRRRSPTQGPNSMKLS